MPGSKPAERLEQVGPDQRGRARARRTRRGRRRAAPGRARPARRRGGRAGLVGAHADLEDAVGIVPLDELGPDDAGVGAVGLLDHHLDHVGVEAHVVVAEQVERRALDRVEHLVGRGAEAGVVVEPAQVRVGRDRGDAVLEVASSLPASMTQQRGVRVVLGGHAGQRVLEPGARVVGDHRPRRPAGRPSLSDRVVRRSGLGRVRRPAVAASVAGLGRGAGPATHDRTTVVRLAPSRTPLGARRHRRPAGACRRCGRLCHDPPPWRDEPVRVLRNTFYASVGFGVLAVPEGPGSPPRAREGRSSPRSRPSAPAAGRSVGRQPTPHASDARPPSATDRHASDAVPPMRLAFDATSLLGARTGVGVFAAEVLARLAGRPDLDVVAFGVTLAAAATPSRAALPPGSRSVRPPDGRPTAAAGLAARATSPPIEWWTGPVDVVHGPNFVVPPARRAAELVTVHDLTCVRFPELCTADTLEYPDLIRRALAPGRHGPHRVAVRGRRGASTRSASTADRVRRHPQRRRPPPRRRADTDAAAGRALAGGDRYILAVGTVEPRKDLPAARRGLRPPGRRPTATLRLVSPGPTAGAPRRSTDADRAPARTATASCALGWVDDERPGRTCCAGAACLAFPSVYEGFGLPPLEAMAAGTPVVATAPARCPRCSATPPCCVPPGDADALAAAHRRRARRRRPGRRPGGRGPRRVAVLVGRRPPTGSAALYHRLAGTSSAALGARPATYTRPPIGIGRSAQRSGVGR